MTIEQKVKDLILSKYKSVREFADVTDLPYGTVDSILRRGFGNSNVENVFKICRVLEISADELGKNKIVPIYEVFQSKPHLTDIDKIIEYTKMSIQKYDDLTINNERLSQGEIELLLNAIDIAIELIKRNRAKRQ